MEKFKSRRCPNCKGTNFSILGDAFQKWDSETGEYGNIEMGDIPEKEDAYMCLNCEKTFKSENDLEVFEPED